MTLYEDLKWRGLIYQETDESLRQKLNEEQMTFYIGTDPTADSLHVGHLMANLVAKRLELYGHKPILVIGGGTGLIGDPSFKADERKLLSIEDSLKNAAGIEKQVKRLLPTATVVNNYQWLSSLNAIEFLRDLGKHFSINYMMAKDSVKSRIEKGISFTEFSYQIIQAWDFEHLYKNYNCTLQIGGQDQWGNITSGSELIRRIHGADKKVYGLTFPLVTKSDGTKFGKTESGAVWLDPAKTSPYEFYQFWINTPDADVITRLKQFTFLSKEEIQSLEESLINEPEKRLAQNTLAKEVVEMVHGSEALIKAIRVSEALFSGEIKDLDVEEIEMGFKNIPSQTVEGEIGLIDALSELSLVQSNREAREMIKNNAVSVNGERVNDTYFNILKENAIGKKYTILRKGKKKYGVIKHS
ncbi:MAG: tyrosine--tRNA ligase [Candidatus Izemoplasmatales bacterium]|uniref:Tyrosine--tRNA ligase n=1 Tax=Hujiaoplasma nucleasis TaxID=2725268 RepID=A0A7L6MZD0_9MOLU|nr:tyrosine--tRNA ligase [Hujiaoplasma nucleasis]QLY39346.1 tyrosine--tRNA ligase [Hujiaoplasma nucleasis]